MSTEDDVKLVNTEETVNAESELLKSIKEKFQTVVQKLLRLKTIAICLSQFLKDLFTDMISKKIHMQLFTILILNTIGVKI